MKKRQVSRRLNAGAVLMIAGAGLFLFPFMLTAIQNALGSSTFGEDLFTPTALGIFMIGPLLFAVGLIILFIDWVSKRKQVAFKQDRGLMLIAAGAALWLSPIFVGAIISAPTYGFFARTLGLIAALIGLLIVIASLATSRHQKSKS